MANSNGLLQQDIRYKEMVQIQRDGTDTKNLLELRTNF